jgi:tetratricopeptide (TPR) repeat protein
VAVCIGAEMGPWQLREQYSALERQAAAEREGVSVPVIPVLLPGGEPPLGFLRQNTWVDLRQGAEDGVGIEILTRAIRGEPPGPDLRPAAEQALVQLCPYRGLLYFREEDAEFFFGRTAAIEQLAQAVATHPLVALVGASGSGKSSVVRAGLLPRLRRSATPVWDIATIVPGDRPMHALAAALSPLLEPDMGEVARLGEINQFEAWLSEGNVALRDVVDRILAKQPGTDRLMLVVDQWEELVTLTKDENVRRRFIDTLLEATEKSDLSVVLTLRGDFFGRAVNAYRGLSDRLQGAQVNLGPMTETELRSAMEEPARRVGLQFEAGLGDTILADAGEEPGNLPLLEFVLRQLWEQRQGALLHREAYEGMGRLGGAIAQKAEGLYARLTAGEQQALQRVFLRLVRPGEGEADTRRRAYLGDFGAEAAALIKTMSDERLLVTAKAVASSGDTVEVAHEALIRNWQLLRTWVDADRQFIVWQLELGAAAAKWRETKRCGDLLLRGLTLTQAREWWKKRPEALSKLERDFIAAGVRRRRLEWTTSGAAVAVTLVTVGHFFAQAVAEKQRADFARERAEELVGFMTLELSSWLSRVGSLHLMERINAKVADYYNRTSTRGASDATGRWRGVSLNNQCDTLLAQGKLDAARRAYKSALAIAEFRVRSDPASTDWQFDLFESHNKVGGVEQAAGNLDAARQAYSNSLAIAERLAQTRPGDSGWQRDVSVSYDRLGDVEQAAGDLEDARQAYERSFAIRERSAKADPSDSQWQRDLSVSYNNFGRVAQAAGNLGAARQAYEKGLVIAERLTQAEPSNGDWQHNLSVTLNRLGDAEQAAGKLEAARQAYGKSLQIIEREAQDDPSNSFWQRDLAACYMKLGNTGAAAGRREEAIKYLQRARSITGRLVRQDTTNMTWKQDEERIEKMLSELKGGAGD